LFWLPIATRLGSLLAADQLDGGDTKDRDGMSCLPVSDGNHGCHIEAR
jgi:hypothetical protein